MTFTFTAIGAATGFQCALVRLRTGHKRFAPRFSRCHSPQTYRRLAHGRYAFDVRAVNGQLVDKTPASKTFKM